MYLFVPVFTSFFPCLSSFTYLYYFVVSSFVLFIFCVIFGFSCVDIGLGELGSWYPGIPLDLYCMLMEVDLSCIFVNPWRLSWGFCDGRRDVFYETGTQCSENVNDLFTLYEH